MELFTPDFGLIFWMFLAFAVLFLLLWKFAWPAIMKGVDSRADLIDKGVLYAREAKAQLDSAKQQAEEFEAEARSRQAEILREADKMTAQFMHQAPTEAAKEAKKQMEAAKSAIEQARKEAQQSFRDEVSAAALEIATQDVRGQLSNPQAQQKLVDNILDQIETAN